MIKSTTDKDTCAGKTPARGLNPTAVLAIAVGVMMCGFAVADISNGEAVSFSQSEAADQALHAHGESDSGTMEPAEYRAALLSDPDALHRATLWLARCIYSETGLKHEQELVAWVVRNRVETGYRGEWTYAGVVKDPFQFSAFNQESLTRDFLISVDSTFTERAWRQAVEVAEQVIGSDASLRPFPITTRHFYSERSLGDADIPAWALEIEPVSVHPYEVDEKRFKFFDGVS